ncbi:hypothetical protein Misp01_46780 [Microtetraspora sp. NBRC 13810]|uniref:hypothetical protein n=1 Tax=Microtetraspora sp. NBRC 13810 TaxID=3030990 RepID=UPI0024A0FECC|nr:hypothetical protein [Microtetraspora sp. NBRC 13810]GLW09549.1 hypothetical protein Misp01_46780 [Microtetraspora sp. NBRC 13810]
MSEEDKPARPAEEILLTLAGAADLVLDRVEVATRRLRATLGRSDLTELLREGHDDLKARGRLTLGRHVPESHLEVLARRAAERRSRDV